MVEIASAILAIFGKIGEYLAAPIGRQLGYLFCFNRNVESLKGEVDKLKTIRDGVQLEVDAATRNVETIKPEVEEWLTSVNGIRAEAERIIEDKTELQKGCLNEWCLNFKSRYSISKKAKTNNQAVIALQRNGKFVKVSSPAPPPRIESTFTSTFKEFESQVSTMNEIIMTLKDDHINVIGICGMGGVGKTTMVEEVAKRVMEENLLDEFAKTVVSQKPEFTKMQTDIAEMLGLKLEEQNQMVRALRLRDRLKDKRILIILDDVWAEFDLRVLGFTLQGGNKGCKLLFTSRNQGLWSELQTKRDIPLEVLSYEEAWHLFKEKVGDSLDTPELQPTAKEIVMRCNGLPLALVIIGGALRNKNENVWNDACRQLRTPYSKKTLPGVDKNLYQSLELSYKYVENDEAKSLFLLCCMFQEDYDIPVDDLVRCGMGLRLFGGIDELGEARDRVFALLDQLKNCYLLLDSQKDNCFHSRESITVHDVVRDVAISIASRDKRAFVISHGVKLTEWPKKDMHDHYPWISVISKEIKELPIGLRSQEVELLLCTNRVVVALDSSLEGMGELRVVDLQYMMIPQLPSSFQLLRNLRTLGLNNCTLDNISIIGELLNLEILSFYGSFIEELPKEIGRLSNLRMLDLRKCNNLERISPGVISGLVQLQELYMRNCSFINWEGEGKQEGRNASLIEFESLSNLNTLEFKLRDAVLLPRIPLFSRLTKYTIVIGIEYLHWPVENRFEKHLELRIDSCVPSECGINSLLKSTEYMDIKGEGLKDVVHELVQQGVEALQHLKYLSIMECDTLEWLANTMDWEHSISVHAIFPILESLYLDHLPNLREICHGQLPPESFGKLREVKLLSLYALTHFLVDGSTQTPSVCLRYLRSVYVMFCNKLGNLFPLSIASGLVQFQKLCIRHCDMMEEIIWNERGKDGNVTTNKIEFPMLEEIELSHLPRLTGFCRWIDNEIEFPRLKELRLHNAPKLKCLFPNTSNSFLDGNQNVVLQPIFSQKVAFPCLEVLELRSLPMLEGLAYDPLPSGSLCKLRKIVVKCCDKLFNVVPSRLLSRLQNLEELIVEDCSSVEEVFDLEGLEINEGDSEMLSQLKYLKLENLPKLNHISKGSIGFMCIPRLHILHVCHCDNMEYLFSATITNSAPQLHELEISSCKMMLGIVPEKNEQGESSVNKIEFPQLKILRLYDLPNFSNFSPKVITETSKNNLQNLVQPLINKKVAFPILEELGLRLQNMNKICCSELQTGSLDRLTSLHVSESGSLQNLLSPFMARYLVHLQTLFISKCFTMEEVVEKEQDEERGGVEKDKVLIFPQLKFLWLIDLPMLRSFWHVDYGWELPSLEQLAINKCPEMKTFSPGFVPSPKLKHVVVEHPFGKRQAKRIRRSRRRVEGGEQQQQQQEQEVEGKEKEE